ncbi:MAG: sugar transferase [Dehalococcoidia bacterium]|nr:sugar transferase [Dehalococcoidia bacterium]
MALPATVVLLPLMAALGLVVRLTSPGPAIFRQRRIGMGGQPFTIYKLRTMEGADDSTRPRAERVEDWNSYVFSLPGDGARTTPLGRFLRESSLDELPQLWNVIKGEMSLVGPRPEIPDLVEQYPSEFHRRHSVRPGLTGLAQVSGRRELTYGETLRYDLEYVDSHPLWRDITILCRTLGNVLRGRD